jgi:hypothetical protein
VPVNVQRGREAALEADALSEKGGTLRFAHPAS